MMIRRITTWFKMFAHQMRELEHGEYHIEGCHTRGFKLCGIYIGWKFVERYCDTCGYRP